MWRKAKIEKVAQHEIVTRHSHAAPLGEETFGFDGGIDRSRTILVRDLEILLRLRLTAAWNPLEGFDNVHPTCLTDRTTNIGFRFVCLLVRLTRW